MATTRIVGRSELGRKIATFINARGWTVTRFARLVGIARPTIYKLINGTTQGDIETHRGLARVMQVTVDDLLGVEVAPDPRTADEIARASVQDQAFRDLQDLLEVEEEDVWLDACEVLESLRRTHDDAVRRAKRMRRPARF